MPSSSSTGANESTASDESSGTATGAGLCDAFVGGPPSTTYDAYTGPIEDAGRCCYWIETEVEEQDPLDPMTLCGRPFVVDGQPRVAACVDRRDWMAALDPRLDGIDSATREALADAWMRDAAAEHASVAAFARFATQLLAVAAPPELLLETQRAMADEVEHAQLCFALASAYAGAPKGPGPLVSSSHHAAIELADAVASTMFEGCIGETLAPSSPASRPDTRAIRSCNASSRASPTTSCGTPPSRGASWRGPWRKATLAFAKRSLALSQRRPRSRSTTRSISARTVGSRRPRSRPCISACTRRSSARSWLRCSTIGARPLRP